MRSLPREFYVPTYPGTVKVTDKNSDAIAYYYPMPDTPTLGKTRWGAKVFYGKQAKPIWHLWFNDQASMGRKIKAAFEARQAYAGYMKERRAKRTEVERKVNVGDFFYTSWGYDQTNIDWYKVIELVGTKSAKVTEVARVDASTGDEGWMQGKSIPGNEPVGEPFIVRVTGDSFKVKDHYAHAWDGLPKHWTAYA